MTLEDANCVNDFLLNVYGGPVTRIQYETNYDVQYWDFYNYQSDQESDAGDFLYYMGHAGYSAVGKSGTILSPLMLQRFRVDPDGYYRSYFNPDKVGRLSASQWDEDLDWAFFAACKTLRNNGSAKRWAET